MRSSTRIIVNTAAQYIRTLINIILTLYSTRLILEALGVDNYGLYILVGGVISMLSFATNALATTTQRFLSYHQGKSNLDQQRNYFANSFYIHLIIGLFVLIFLLSFIHILFNGFLNIPDERLYAAKITYAIVSVILLFTFMTSPFRAVLISHENIVYLSIVDILDGLLKVVIAIVLLHISTDKLIAYSFLMGLIQIFNLLAIGLFCIFKYKECWHPSLKRIKIIYLKEILSFAGWTVYSIGCVIGRTQGVAVIINKFFGAAVNAAYGIGFQISGYVTFISESILNAVRPQIIRAEGEGNHRHMLWLAQMSSKYGLFLLCCIAIPCIAEMPNLLGLWLKEVPEYATMFSRMVLLAAIFDTSTSGLWVANQAIGNIKTYSISINSVKILTLPVSFLLVKNEFPLLSVAISYVFFEALCAFLRIAFLHKNGNLDIRKFIICVYGRLIIPMILFISATIVLAHCSTAIWGILMTFTISNLVFIVSFFLFGMKREEKQLFLSFAQKKTK